MTPRKFREEHGMTQAQLAEYLGLSTAAVAKWEGKGAPKYILTILEKLDRFEKLKPDMDALARFLRGNIEKKLGENHE